MRTNSLVPRCGSPRTFERRRIRSSVVARAGAIATALACAAPAAAQSVPSPEETFGHEIGADYELINYQELSAYWTELAEASDRMVLDTIGFSELDRPQLMAIITSPENHANLDRYREIAERLARARGVSEAEARELAAEGKAVVWIDGGLHANEVLGAQQLTELVYRLVAESDAETLRFLADLIILVAHANPDGHDLVADWYMREDDPEARSSGGVPILYQHYAGHDNNRDFYMGNLAETENILRVQYREWYPQIIYNHHQSGPAGMVMFAPPFRDPPNHNIPPLILTSIQQVGSAMHHRFVQEGKGGTGSRSVAGYSTWWNGGLRTTPYFHNSIGLLTETIGHPTPMEVPFIADRQISSSDLPLPVEPGRWHFRQSVDYSLTANRAVLDYASRNRDILLFNIWRMGMNSIEEGRGDAWTVTPHLVELAGRSVSGRGSEQDFRLLLRHPDQRDPSGYVLPADQADGGTLTRFVNALLKNGVEVHRASGEFSAGGRTYPAGSYLVRNDQAYRPHVLDMFEPQSHPNDFEYPGGPPIRPYDLTGWTLTYQMGVDFDRLVEGFPDLDAGGPFQPLDGLADPPPGTVGGVANPAGYLFSHEVNDAFVAVNRFLADGAEVHWLTEPVTVGGEQWDEGTFHLAAGSGVSGEEVAAVAAETGVDFLGVRGLPGTSALPLRPLRVGLWDEYGGSMPSGWTRFVLDEFEFPYEVVFAPRLDRGDLASEFDVLVFPPGAIPSAGGGGGGGANMRDRIPEEYHDRLGSVSVDETVPRILEFLEAGGSVVALGSSTNLARHAGVPVNEHLVDQEGEQLSDDDFFVPGSILGVKLEGGTPLTHGLPDRLDVLFANDPVFRLGAGNVRRVGWFDVATPLRSGWAWGEEHLEGGTVLAEAEVGAGKLFLFTPDLIFRGQTHGAFPLIFNAMYYGTAGTPARLGGATESEADGESDTDGADRG
ncbi:MAG: M14 metallopeptidase family protein [Gemmatimonadota bacterium]